MKKVTFQERLRDVKRSLNHRKAHISGSNLDINQRLSKHCLDINNWVQDEVKKGLRVTKYKKGNKSGNNNIVINLPINMDFSENQDATIQCFTAIRKLVSIFEAYKFKKIPKKAYKLRSVNFDELASISTSAALVLTAEVSKWNISIKKN
ncbi:hypothetical protein P4S67_04960 [Pseudoalteromonas sp. B137]